MDAIKAAQEKLLRESVHKDDFPINVFPDDIQWIIESLHQNLRWPKDFISCSMLFTASVAAGSRFRTMVKFGWEEAPSLYILFVGHPGVAKTHAMKWPMAPIISTDRYMYKEYMTEVEKFEKMSKMTKLERKEAGMEDAVKPPVLKKMIVEDITLEALIKVLSENKHGVGANFDEASSWFKNFNRYNKGSDIGTWLKLWSQGDVVKDRVGSASIRVNQPFVSLIGGIQPKILKDVKEQQMEDNGMLDRILFAWPRIQQMEVIPRQDTPMEDQKRRWAEIVHNIKNYEPQYPKGFSYHRFTMSENAKDLYFNWVNDITSRANNNDEVWFRGVVSKMYSQVARMCMIMELLNYGCGLDHNYGIISTSSMESAIRMSEYFIETSIKVRDELHDQNPLADATLDEKRLYAALPQTFNRGEGEKVASDIGIGLRTFRKILGSKTLISKLQYGVYEKTR